MAHSLASKYRKYFWWIGISFFNLLILFYFNNCSEVSFQEAEKGKFNLILGGEDVEVVENLCSQLALRSTNQSVTIEDPRNEFDDRRFTCDFGRNGNLERRDQYFQARLEQSVNINIPQGAIICDVEFSFLKDQPMQFDDHFLFMFNNNVLATSIDKLIPLLEDSTGVPVYTWDKLKGSRWGVDNGDEKPFCLGESDNLGKCSWPLTEKLGSISLDFHPKLIKGLMAKDLNRSSHEFKFVMLGDNDNNDCQHSELNFSVKVDYVVRPQQ